MCCFLVFAFEAPSYYIWWRCDDLFKLVVKFSWLQSFLKIRFIKHKMNLSWIEIFAKNKKNGLIQLVANCAPPMVIGATKSNSRIFYFRGRLIWLDTKIRKSIMSFGCPLMYFYCSCQLHINILVSLLWYIFYHEWLLVSRKCSDYLNE